MKQIYLCGHTGSKNRGCDAIIRATAGVLRQCGADSISAMSFHVDEDKALGLDQCVDLTAYPSKTPLMRAASLLRRKLTGDSVWGNRAYYADLFRKAGQDDLIFNVGGDTYCYGTPSLSYALNEMAAEHGVKTVLWGCSLDRGLLKDRQMREDMNRYTWIVARESLSCEMLKECVAQPDRVLLGCDPAFWLVPEQVELLDRFLPGHTVGLNLSPLVFADTASETDMMYRNAVRLIEDILSQTDMAVCLIPHVYDLEKNTQDIMVLRNLYGRFAENPRVMLIEREYNSSQLKYIISNCRFFVGARTHSMIAAYSSGVPALALSYSLKSLGIARDLFGSEEGYALSWKDLKQEDQLSKLFATQLMAQEDLLRERYAKIMPDYKNRIIAATKQVLNSTGKCHA